MVARSLLSLLIFVSGLSRHGHCHVPQTGDVVSNIAYFHMLDCYATAGSGNPLHKMLQLTLDSTLYASAKARADQCPEVRRTTISPNRTEVFFVSDIEKSQLNARARERMREDADTFSEVDEMARVMHAAYYTDQFGIVFDKETIGEKGDVGQAVDGTFSFGCDMSVCKGDGDKKKKAVTVCHFVRGVAAPKRTISKAEADRRTAVMEKAEKEVEEKKKASGGPNVFWNVIFGMMIFLLF